MIAIITPSSELSICFSHMDRVATMVKQAVREAGGLPFEIRMTAPRDFLAGAGRAKATAGDELPGVPAINLPVNGNLVYVRKRLHQAL